MSLKFVLYTSIPRIDRRSIDESLLYLQSRNRNRADGITGYLHRDDDAYAQLIEGPPRAIDALVARLHRDPRHSDMTVICEGYGEKRLFPAWDMAFTDREAVSFEAFGRSRGLEPDIATAPPDEVLAFMTAGVGRDVAQYPGECPTSRP